MLLPLHQNLPGLDPRRNVCADADDVEIYATEIGDAVSTCAVAGDVLASVAAAGDDRATVGAAGDALATTADASDALATVASVDEEDCED